MMKRVGQDYPSILAYFESYGYIFSGPKFLFLYEHIHIRGIDTWAVFFAIGKGYLPTAIQSMPYWLDYFSFARLEKARHGPRTLSMERICRMYGIDVNILKGRKKC